MKVKTLVAAMMYELDEVELYTDNMDLMSRMDPETFKASYGDFKVKKFWVYTEEDELGLIWTTLEVVLK